MRHKGMSIRLMIAGLVMGMALTAQATLIGDSVDIRFVIPNVNFDESGTTTVTSDDSDAVTFTANSGFSFLVDPFDEGFVITYQQPNSGLSVGAGSSFVFSDLQWQGLPGQIIGLTMVHNWSTFTGSTSYYS